MLILDPLSLRSERLRARTVRFSWLVPHPLTAVRVKVAPGEAAAYDEKSRQGAPVARPHRYSSLTHISPILAIFYVSTVNRSSCRAKSPGRGLPTTRSIKATKVSGVTA